METSIWQEFDQDVLTLGVINTNNQSMINSFVSENSITFPILFDPGSPGGVQGGGTYNAYYMPNDGSPYPRDFIVDQNGFIQYANNEIDFQWMMYVIDELLVDSLIYGDLNGDSQVDILDIVLLINIIIEVYEPTDIESLRADVNQDNQINILDVVLVVDIIID